MLNIVGDTLFIDVFTNFDFSYNELRTVIAKSYWSGAKMFFKVLNL